MQDISSGIEHMPPAVEAQSLNHWATREVLGIFFTTQQSYAS